MTRSRTRLTKRLLTISLLLPLVAISSVARANHNYQHRPNQPAEYAAFNQAVPTPAVSKTELQVRPSSQHLNSRKPCEPFYGSTRSPTYRTACQPIDSDTCGLA